MGRQPMARGPNMAFFNFRENFDCFIQSTVLGVMVKGVRGKNFLRGVRNINGEWVENPEEQ